MYLVRLNKFKISFKRFSNDLMLQNKINRFFFVNMYTFKKDRRNTLKKRILGS